jgi:hypothetical protein
MRAVLMLVGVLSLFGPLVWAMAGDATTKPRRTELWLYAQAVTVLCFGVAWWLRGREVASWPREEGVVMSSTQTGMYTPGVLAMRIEVEHGRGGLANRVETKVRVAAAEVARYAVGARVTLAVNPQNPREGEVVETPSR